MRRHLFRAGFVGFLAAVALSDGGLLHAQSGSVLIQERFEDANVASRGWYDFVGVPLSTTEKYSGVSSLECRFAVGATGCSGGRLGRHLFTASDSIYLSFYIKYSANWVGSGRPYHPHMFYFLSNLDGTYAVGLQLSDSIRQKNGGIPSSQSGQLNIVTARTGQDLTAITEQRSVARDATVTAMGMETASAIRPALRGGIRRSGMQGGDFNSSPGSLL